MSYEVNVTHSDRENVDDQRPALAGSTDRDALDVAAALMSLSLSVFDATAGGVPTENIPHKLLSNTESGIETKQCASSKNKVECVVVVQDACDLHKFSRRLRQRDLDNIVERPERTQAALLGIMSAKAALELSDQSTIDIHHCHRKGCLSDKAVEAIHGSTYPQKIRELSTCAGAALSRNELEIPAGLSEGDLYLADGSLDALNGCLGAIYDGVDAIYDDSRSYQRVHVCLRPPGHHAADEHPSGFCWINNVHIAIAYARQTYNIDRAAILDIDLHHGDGSQSIAWQLNETRPSSVGYFSMHDINSYPCEMGDREKISEASISIAAHGHAIHNIHLRSYKNHEEFEEIYKTHYSTLLQKAEEYLRDGFLKGEKCLLCISAGYDASEHESASMQRHAVNLPTLFYERFTKDAVGIADKYCSSKVFSVLEGGYSDRAITSASSAHLLGLASPKFQLNHLSEIYNLENLKLLEKFWPGKSRRRSGKMDKVPNEWLRSIEKLCLEHIKRSRDSLISPKDELVSCMDRMTLRVRKAKGLQSKSFLTNSKVQKANDPPQTSEDVDNNSSELPDMAKTTDEGAESAQGVLNPTM